MIRRLQDRQTLRLSGHRRVLFLFLRSFAFVADDECGHAALGKTVVGAGKIEDGFRIVRVGCGGSVGLEKLCVRQVRSVSTATGRE